MNTTVKVIIILKLLFLLPNNSFIEKFQKNIVCYNIHTKMNDDSDNMIDLLYFPLQNNLHIT